MNTYFARLSTLGICLGLGLSLAACAGDDTGESASSGDSDTAGDDMTVSGLIDADVTWSEDKILDGIVTVGSGAILTIEPGVTVYGKKGSALVIAQGSRLEAAGTAEAPIVFTSSQPEGTRARGNWGGVVLLGSGVTNLVGGVGIAEGLEEKPNYGGGTSPDPASSCGTLKYVRVEYAGYELTTDNELNGVTFYSCGSGTTVDHLQVHMGEDDGIEMFGGAWSGHHILITGAGDDSVDIDQGWRGSLQHVVIQQDPGTGNYAFEISNQEANRDAEPRTKPMIANATAIGGDGSKAGGIKLKEGAAAEFHHSIIMGFNNAQVELTEAQTWAQAEAGEIVIKNSLFFDNDKSGTGAYVVSDGETWDLKSFVEDAANGNLFGMDPMLASTAWGSLNPTPDAASPVHIGVATPAGFESADYIGGVKDAAGDWTVGWTNYAAN